MDRREFIRVFGTIGVGSLISACSGGISQSQLEAAVSAARQTGAAEGKATEAPNFAATGEAYGKQTPSEMARPVATSAATATEAGPASTQTRVATRPAVAPAKGVKPETQTCEDGKLVFVLKAPEGQVFQRTPVGEAERADIVEVGRLGGAGFGGWDRAIFVVPRLGNVWQVNVLNTSTVAERGFCGKNEDVARWAIQAHVPSLQQASRDARGNQPSADEIGVYRFDFEGRALIAEKPSNVDPATILGMFDVSFNQSGRMSNVPIHMEARR